MRRNRKEKKKEEGGKRKDRNGTRARAVRDANGFDEYRCASEVASGFNLQKEDEKTGVEEGKSNELSPLWKLNYSCYRRFEPMIRTGREKEKGGDRKFQFIKLLSSRTRPVALASFVPTFRNHRHIFFATTHRSLSLLFSFPLVSPERAAPYACTHTLASHLSVSSCFRRAVPIKREPYLGLAGTR